MTPAIPTWALRAATPEDLGLARDTHGRGNLPIKWPDPQALRQWAKQHGWPTPSSGFETAFINHMLENRENFELALTTSGITLQLPLREYTLTPERLGQLDAWYAAVEDMGILGRRPIHWGALVYELREIRHAVEAGVVVKIAGAPEVLNTWATFYDWAHRRYHALEDGYDKWIGDDA